MEIIIKVKSKKLFSGYENSFLPPPIHEVRFAKIFPVVALSKKA